MGICLCGLVRQTIPVPGAMPQAQSVNLALVEASIGNSNVEFANKLQRVRLKQLVRFSCPFFLFIFQGPLVLHCKYFKNKLIC